MQVTGFGIVRFTLITNLLYTWAAVRCSKKINMYVDEFSTVTMTCPYQDVGKIIWRSVTETYAIGSFVKNDLRNRTRVFVDRKNGLNNLQIERFSQEDNRNYTCSFVNKEKQITTADFYIFIKKLPSAVIILGSVNDTITAREGELFTLMCNVTSGVPPETIKWKYGDVVLLEGGPGTLTYTFTPERSDHLKKFECIVNNSASVHIAAHAFFYVQWKPNVSVAVYPSNVVKEGDNITLECVIDSNPQATKIKWYYKEQRFSSDKTSDQDSCQLKLTDIHRNQSGSYSCSALNDIGESQSYIVIDVQSTLIKRIKAFPKTMVTEGDDLTLICYFGNIPLRTQVKWKYNSVLLCSGHLYEYNSIHFPSVNKSQSGNYSCEVDTELGFDKKTIIIYIDDKQLQSTSHSIVTLCLIILGILVSFLICWYIIKALKKKIKLHFGRNQPSIERSMNRESSNTGNESHYDEIESVYYDPVQIQSYIDNVVHMAISRVDVPIIQKNDLCFVNSRTNFSVVELSVESSESLRLFPNPETISNKTQSMASDDSYIVPFISYAERIKNRKDMHQETNTSTDQFEIYSFSSNESETHLKSDNQYEPLRSVNLNEHPYLSCDTLEPNQQQEDAPN